jgi:hypothetical protein
MGQYYSQRLKNTQIEFLPSIFKGITRLLRRWKMNYRAASHAASKALQAWMRGKPRGIRPKTEQNAPEAFGNLWG